MRRWFLSYNSQDFELAQRFIAAVGNKDADATVFFAPKSLRPGAYWMPELAREIAEATAFVLLVGKNGLGPWQTIEYYEAFNRRAKEHDFPVILLLLDGEPAPGLPFLTQLHWIVTANPELEQSVAKLIDAAAGRGATPGELWRHTAPYRGLSAMTESDADFFFGRTRETAEVLGALGSTPDKISASSRQLGCRQILGCAGWRARCLDAAGLASDDRNCPTVAASVPREPALVFSQT